MSNVRLHESGTLVESASKVPGVFRARLITEGRGSSGIYNRDFLERDYDVYEGAPSFMNHPIDPERPEQRDVTSIAARIKNVSYDVVEGVAGWYGDLHVDSRWREFVNEYKDVIGLSIYGSASGTKNSDGVLVVESIDRNDPFRSVDFVVAAGRGGRIERAMESFRAIESSIGQPDGKPASEPPGRGTEKEKMDEETQKAFNAITESLATVVAFVNESKQKSQGELQAQVDKAALEAAVETAVAAYKEKDKLIEQANLLPSQVEELRASALRGEDVVPLIAKAQKVLEEAKSAGQTRVQETLYTSNDGEFNVTMGVF